MLNNSLSYSELEDSEYKLNFRFKFDCNQIKWYQMIQSIINVQIKLVFLYENRIVIFIDPEDYLKAYKKYIEFHELFNLKSHFHIRLIPFSQNLKKLVVNWFYNLRDKINVEIQYLPNNSSYEISIGVQKNLRQFIFGQNGREISMLKAFLTQNVEGKYTFNFIIK